MFKCDFEVLGLFWREIIKSKSIWSNLEEFLFCKENKIYSEKQEKKWLVAMWQLLYEFSFVVSNRILARASEIVQDSNNLNHDGASGPHRLSFASPFFPRPYAECHPVVPRL